MLKEVVAGLQKKDRIQRYFTDRINGIYDQSTGIVEWRSELSSWAQQVLCALLMDTEWVKKQKADLCIRPGIPSRICCDWGDCGPIKVEHSRKVCVWIHIYYVFHLVNITHYIIEPNMNWAVGRWGWVEDYERNKVSTETRKISISSTQKV